MSANVTIGGYLLGWDLRRPQKPRIEHHDMQSPVHPYRRFHCVAVWLGPLCLITRGNFYWDPPKVTA